MFEDWTGPVGTQAEPNPNYEAMRTLDFGNADATASDQKVAQLTNAAIVEKITTGDPGFIPKWRTDMQLFMSQAVGARDRGFNLATTDKLIKHIEDSIASVDRITHNLRGGGNVDPPSTNRVVTRASKRHTTVAEENDGPLVAASVTANTKGAMSTPEQRLHTVAGADQRTLKHWEAGANFRSKKKQRLGRKQSKPLKGFKQPAKRKEVPATATHLLLDTRNNSDKLSGLHEE